MNLNIKPKEKLNKEKQKLHIKCHNYNNKGITLIALIITIIFSYDEKLKCSNNKGFLLATI